MTKSKTPFCAVLPYLLSALFIACASPGQTTPSVSAPLTRTGAVTTPPATLIGRAPLSQQTTVSIVLPLRNKPELTELLKKLQTKSDPLYHKYLKPAEFTARFGPAKADVDAVVAFAQSAGLKVTSVSPNNVIVKAEGPSSVMESAFGVHLNLFAAADGSIVRKPDQKWTLPASISSRVLDVLGLDTSLRGHPLLHQVPTTELGTKQNEEGLPGLSPYDISQVYNLSTAVNPNLPPYPANAVIPATGSNQIYGLYELDGWTQDDITDYENKYGLPQTIVALEAVDGGTGKPTGYASDECTLDIDMLQALAPNMVGIAVYQAPPISTYTSFCEETVDIFNQMATDDLATVISVSYGLPEVDIVANGDSSYLTSEDDALNQLASQGQTVCVAAGDAAAYADQSYAPNGTVVPNVDDPGEQPLVVCVGGTNFDSDPSNSLTYPGETSWFDPYDTGRGDIGTGGGGGVSPFFSIPDYQQTSGFATNDPQISTSNRNTPDVSLYADYDSSPSYSIYYSPPGGTAGWYAYNGTSAASPLWASFLGLVNEQAAVNGFAALGEANESIYYFAENGQPSDFHDINDGSNNGYYYTYAGYDQSTGWGSFNGYNLLSDMTGGWLAGFSFSPSSVYPYVYTTGTVTLSGPAPYDGATVAVDYNGSLFENVSIAAGASSGTFSVYSTDPGTYPLTATYGGVTVPASFTVTAPIVSSVSASAAKVIGSNSLTGTVTLTGNAPYGGASVALTSSDPSVLSVPSSVDVAQDTTSSTFDITTAAVGSPVTVTITATYGDYSVTTTVIVEPIPLKLSLSPTTVVGGANVTGRLTIYPAAPAAGVVVKLSSNNANVVVPSTVTLTSGETTTTFSITTKAVTATATVVINANGNDYQAAADLTVNAAAPTITSFSPTSGPVGTAVVITGTNFFSAQDGSVKFSNAISANFTIVSSTEIKTTVPSGAVTGKITVTAAGGTATSPTSFTIIAPPVISSFTPASGPPGTTVKITGSSFTGTTAVKFHSVAASSFTVVSASSITVTVPAQATTGTISVTTPGGTVTSANTFTVIPIPTVASFSPTSGAIGAVISIAGTNFTGATEVTFNGVKATTYTVTSATKISATVPAGATTGKITVTTPGGTATSSGTFTVIPAPVITSFSPTSAAPGAKVTLTGTGFTSATSVKFNGVTATFTVVSATSVTATVPAQATTGKISITTPGGTGTSSSSFTVVPAPTIKAFSPTSGAVGASIAISGANFTGATKVTFNGVAATSFTVNASTKITATVPAGATTGPIAVTTPAGTATSGTSFTVN